MDDEVQSHRIFLIYLRQKRLVLLKTEIGSWPQFKSKKYVGDQLRSAIFRITKIKNHVFTFIGVSNRSSMTRKPNEQHCSDSEAFTILNLLGVVFACKLYTNIMIKTTQI